jgi:hypothetical protein
MPENVNLAVRLVTALKGLSFSISRIYAKNELVERVILEAEENDRLRELTAPAGLHTLFVRPAKMGSAARALLVEELLLNSPRWLCHPICVNPVEDLLLERPSVVIPDGMRCRLRALISYTFWWKYYARIPASVRNLAWTAMLDGCSARLVGDVERAAAAEALALLLVDGNWPIAVDYAGELIVLALK